MTDKIIDPENPIYTRFHAFVAVVFVVSVSVTAFLLITHVI